MTNMNCEHVVDYLNRSLTEEEMLEFEEHLKTCTDCQEMIEAVGELPYLADPVEPPAEMKARILSNVFDEEVESEPEPIDKLTEKPIAAPVMKPTTRKSWWTPLIAAALLLSLLGNAYAISKLSDPEEVETETAFQSLELQPSEVFEGTAKAAIIKENDSMDLVVQAGQLEDLEGGEVYQVWLLKEGQPIPTGAFTPNNNGEGAVYYSMEENTEGWDTIAITREPQAGNEVPQGEIVLSSEI